MNNSNNPSNLEFLFQSFERNYYFPSKLLTVQGFNTEQLYFINKNRLINCLIHGHGILYGLEVQDVIEPNSDSNKIKIKISAGVAIDCYGREIVVTDSEQEILVEEEIYQSDKKNYLYLEYQELPKDPAPALVDEFNCNEQKTCAKSHLQETFKLTVSDVPPASIITGTVQGESQPIPGAKIKALKVVESQDPENTDETVKAVTFTDELGKYELFVPAGKYSLQTSAPGYESKRSDVNIADSLELIEAQNFVLTSTLPDSIPQSCEELTQDYYTEYLRFPPECNSSGVFIAVLEGQETIQVNEELTAQYRSIIYNNPMLHELLCNHLNDFNNPHRTTAEQVGALRSVNNVGNVGNVNNGNYVPNINLVEGDNITIVPDNINKTIQISTNFRLEPENDREKIKSVETDREAGNSPNFARADHVHDLKDEVVTSPKIGGKAVTSSKIDNKAVTRATHLADDITGLITSSDKSITFTPNTADKTIDLSTNIATGIVTFEEITSRPPRNFNRSEPITPFPETNPAKKMEGVAIIMAVEVEVKNPDFAQFTQLAEGLLGKLERSSYVFMGDTALANPRLPLTFAFYNPDETFFKIFLFDRWLDRDRPDTIDWKVRWWAIPARPTEQIEMRVKPRDNNDFFASPVTLKIAMNPGITRTELLKETGINSTELQASLTQLQTDGLIKVEGSGNSRKFFLQ